MNKLILYKGALLFPLVVLMLFNKYNHSNLYLLEVYYSIGLIFLIGIPHGALDHLIFNSENKNRFFTIFYWFLGVSNIVLWFFFPVEIAFIFLLISAYHFGQTQFAFIKKLKRKYLFFISWGLTIIILLLSKHNQSIKNYIITRSNNLEFYNYVFFYLDKKIIFGVLFLITIGYLIYFFLTKKMTKYELIKQLGIFFGILFFISYSSLVTGFACFFVFCHSSEALSQEYIYLKKKQLIYSIRDFVLLLSPYTLGSYSIIIALYILGNFDIINLSQTSLLILVVSTVTLPHSIIMSLFYHSSDEKLSN